MKRPSVTRPVDVENAPLWFANDFWPRHIAEQKFLFAGKSGSGKTVSIRLLFQSALMGFMGRVKRRALIYDAKGDWPAIVEGATRGWLAPPPVIKLYPFDSDGYGYDFHADFKKSKTPFAKAVNFAKTLIPKMSTGGDENANFFTSSARLLLTWVTYLIHQRAKRRWTLRDIIVAATNPSIIEVILKQNGRSRDLLKVFKGTEHTFSNIIQTIGSYLCELEPAATAWENHIKQGRKLTFSDWLRDEGILILCGVAEDPQAIEPLNALMLEFLRQELRKLPEHPWHEPDVPETWLFLDEFQQLSPQPNIVDFFTLSRSKGATQVIGFQEIGQLMHNYGENLTNTILGQCGYVGIMQLESPATGKYFADRIGSYEQLISLRQSGTSDSVSHTEFRGIPVWEPVPPRSYGSGTSRGTSEQLITRPGVLASQFTQLRCGGPDLLLDAYYVADGPYERRSYSALRGPCPLAPLSRDFENYRPLRSAKTTEPRGFTEADFNRLGIETKDLPRDCLDWTAAPLPRAERLKKLIAKWDTIDDADEITGWEDDPKYVNT